MALNPRQLAFVNEYLIDSNATRAAAAVGYSARTAHAQGCALLKNPKIRAEIDKGVALQKTSIASRAMKKAFTKQVWLRELQRIAQANMDDFARIVENEVANGRGGGKTKVTTVELVPTASRLRALGSVIKKITETKNGIGIELHSKQAALETLGKHYGWLTNDPALPPTTGDGPQVHLFMPPNGREAKVETKPDEPTPEQSQQVTTPGKDDNNGTSDKT